MTRGPGGVSDCGLEEGPGCRREERREHLRRSGPLWPGYVRRRTVARRGRWPVGHVAGLEWRRLLFAARGVASASVVASLFGVGFLIFTTGINDDTNSIWGRFEKYLAILTTSPNCIPRFKFSLSKECYH
jgi:hypothetical protein